MTVKCATFEMLSAKAQKQLAVCENLVIGLMVTIAITSIIWSISLHILSGDFYNGLIGAKLAFHKRDFSQLDNRAKEIFYQDLGNLINETYSVHKTIPNELQAVTTTIKPKTHKIAHVFQAYSSRFSQTNSTDNDNDEYDYETEDVNVTDLEKIQFDPEYDRKILASMTIDVFQTLWSENAAVQYVYNFPLLSEIVAIVWTAMCLIFQSGVKKHWGLPKPWRIVVPSILIFFIMTLATLIYTILSNRFLTNFCNDLRANLTAPNALSCGEAISVLRPIIRQHAFSHDFYLILFRFSYIFCFLLWLLALLVMFMRFMLVIDFQLVDIKPHYDDVEAEQAHKAAQFIDVPLTAAQQQLPQQLLKISEHQKSEEDFQSAKSHLSEVIMPLLESQQAPQQQQLKTLPK